PGAAGTKPSRQPATSNDTAITTSCDQELQLPWLIPVESSKGTADRNEEFTVARTGNVTVTFTMLNVGGNSSFPEELIDKQVERLRDAQSR
ncbi:hypothetical protein ACWD3C_23960, partial [Streptomyces sp. NPDC002845]